MTLSVIVVAGLGRCGTTMVMHMLNAGGMDCIGNRAGFEDGRTIAPIDRDWFASLGGKAVKVIDPHHNTMAGDVPKRVIWLDRDPVEQMRSHVKIQEQLLGLTTDRQQRRSMLGNLSRDRRAAMAAIGSAPLLVLRFESLLARAWHSSEIIATFLQDAGISVDIDAMAAVVKRRAPECAPDLAIELEYSRVADAAEATVEAHP